MTVFCIALRSSRKVTNSNVRVQKNSRQSGLLTKVKDPLPTEKQSGVVYEVLCTCGKVYIGDTKHRVGTGLKDHKDAYVKCLTEKSVIAEHA